MSNYLDTSCKLMYKNFPFTLKENMKNNFIIKVIQTKNVFACVIRVLTPFASTQTTPKMVCVLQVLHLLDLDLDSPFRTF